MAIRKIVEMGTDDILRKHARKVDKKNVCVDYRLFTNGEDICFSMMDLSDHFDPTEFYELNKEDYPGKHMGIGLVIQMAREVRYFSAFNSNNIIVYLDTGDQKQSPESSPAGGDRGGSE